MTKEIKEIYVILIIYPEEERIIPVQAYDNRADAIKMGEQVFTCMQKDGEFGKDDKFDRQFGYCRAKNGIFIKISLVDMNDTKLDEWNPADYG